VWDGALLIFQLSQKPQQLKRTSSVSSIILQSDSGQRYIISSSPSTLGRRTLATSAITNLIDFGNEVSGKSVSRRHAKLEWIEHQWRITPLHGVNNRTLINGAQIMPKQFNILQKNNKLTLGKLKLRVVDIDQHPKDENDINHSINTEFYDREEIT
jgi:pSer/pThr/pTyr-binding forkhead associated (FHA) protein